MASKKLQSLIAKRNALERKIETIRDQIARLNDQIDEERDPATHASREAKRISARRKANIAAGRNPWD